MQLKTLADYRSMVWMAEFYPRLVEDPSKSHGDAAAGNMLMHGDNLPAMRAMMILGYAGTVDCVQIDPPYNTGQQFESYGDKEAPEEWFNQMRVRLALMYRLLRTTGFLACHIDDTNAHRTRQILDDVFGSDNYWGTFHVHTKHSDPSVSFRDPRFPRFMEQVQVYRKSPDAHPFAPADGSPVSDYIDGAALSDRSREGGVTFRGGKKPESLIQLVYSLFAPTGGTVFDGYLGSGTGAAVATKMGLQWYAVARHHMESHCLPRLRAVVDGTDETGITSAVGWRGGSGFKYFDVVDLPGSLS